MDALKEAVAEAARLKNALAWKERELERELAELGTIHRERLATPGEMSVYRSGSGRCIAADALERGAEKLAGSPMPAVVNRSANN